MIERVTVDQLYAKPGFDEMVTEYAELSIKSFPAPSYLKKEYLPLEAAGLLTVWAAMRRGIVVGFASCLISKLPKYGIPVAIAESIFVRKSVRSSGLGIRLIDTVERHAAASGVPTVLFSCPIGSDFHKVLEQRLYSAETTTYVRVLPCQK